MDDLVEQIANLIDEFGEYESWTQTTRRSWQEEVLKRVHNELEAREDNAHWS